MSRWAYIAFLFYSINMLNNWAFAFNISVPVHIILRSFGSVTTMLAGVVRGKRYSKLQVSSVVLLTIGVLVSAWADSMSKVRISHIFNFARCEVARLIIAITGEIDEGRVFSLERRIHHWPYHSSGRSNPVSIHGSLHRRHVHSVRRQLDGESILLSLPCLALVLATVGHSVGPMGPARRHSSARPPRIEAIRRSSRTISNRHAHLPSTIRCRISPSRRVVPIPQRVRAARVHLWRQPPLGQVFRSHGDDCAEHPEACQLYPQHDHLWT